MSTSLAEVEDYLRAREEMIEQENRSKAGGKPFKLKR